MRKRTVKTLFGLLILIEILLLPMPWAVFRTNSSQAVKSLIEWRRNPTPQTEAAWLVEKRKLDRYEFVLRAISVTLLIGNAGLIILTWRRLNRRALVASQDPLPGR